MDDLISRSELLKSYDIAKMVEYDETGCGVDRIAIPVDTIKKAPAIDAEPVRHGRWIETNKPGWVNGQYYATPRLVCPFCTREAAHYYSVEHAEHGGSVTELYWIRTDCCPHCGAKMDLK